MQEVQDISVPTPTAPKRGWNWGWGVATVYTVFALGTLGWAYYSFSQKVDLVSNDYYNKEINFDKHMARQRNSQALATPVRETVDANAKSITLHFPIAVSKGNVLFYRASETDNDTNVPLNCNAANEMSISTDKLMRGQWRVQVEWESNGKEYYDEFSLNI